MPRGFAHPYLLIAVLVIIGSGVIVYSGSKNISGLVLGTKTRKENIYYNRTSGIKVTVISPNSSWDLTEYLCATKEECEKSPTSGKWWKTVSGAPTTVDGHQVFIEKSADWFEYGYVKITVKTGGSSGMYLSVTGNDDKYLIVDLDMIGSDLYSVEFI